MMDQQQTNQLTNKQEKLHFQIMFCLCLGSIVLTLNSHQSQFMHKSITTLSENKYLLKFQPHISKQDQCKFKATAYRLFYKTTLYFTESINRLYNFSHCYLFFQLIILCFSGIPKKTPVISWSILYLCRLRLLKPNNFTDLLSNLDGTAAYSLLVPACCL